MKNLKKFLFVLILIVFLCFMFFWKLPVILTINSLKVPEDAEVLYDTKVIFSDVYESKILGEKVIKCDEGYNYVKNYVEENNSLSQLQYINVAEYFGMTDDAVYFSDFDDNFDLQNMSAEEMNKYVKIRYKKEIFAMPWHYIDIIYNRLSELTACLYKFTFQ